MNTKWVDIDRTQNMYDLIIFCDGKFNQYEMCDLTESSIKRLERVLANKKCDLFLNKEGITLHYEI